MPAPILNLADVELLPRPAEYAPEGAAAQVFECRTGRVGLRLGARQLGYNITAVAPGKAAYPCHAHRVNEEMFFVLEGQGELRWGEERQPIRAGDFIACPAGGPAHQIRNTGRSDLRFLAVSTQLSPEVCDYPDSGKFAVYAEFPGQNGGPPQPFYFMGRPAQMLDYWEGEGESA